VHGCRRLLEIEEGRIKGGQSVGHVLIVSDKAALTPNVTDTTQRQCCMIADAHGLAIEKLVGDGQRLDATVRAGQ